MNAILKKQQLKLLHFLSLFGPGILFAGAAVGGSHLVQSTRAGALFGFKLLLLIMLINVLKYPFYEFSQRFTAVTDKNLLQGYYELNKAYLIIFLVVSVGASFVTIAAVSFIAASLLSYLSYPAIPLFEAQPLVLMFCTLILFIGQYRLLDKSIKVMMLTLSLCVILAVVMALFKGPQWNNEIATEPLWSFSSLTFLLALMGWMPAPIDSSAWASLWLQQRNQSVGFSLNLKQTLFDFNFGYVLTTVLAILFMSLGALVMHQSGEQFSPSGLAFTQQFIGLFGKTLGSWSKAFVAIAAFAAMFSTTLTCLDAYPRVITKSIVLLKQQSGVGDEKLYWGLLVLICLASVFFVSFFIGNLKYLVDFATTMAFLTSPILAYMNYKVVYSNLMPKYYQPSLLLKYLSICGLSFLGFVTIAFLGSWAFH